MQMDTILVASTRNNELQPGLQRYAASNSLRIEVWDRQIPLRAHLAACSAKILLADLSLIGQSSASSQSLVGDCQADFPETAVVLLATPAERPQAVSLLTQGAADYLLLPVEATELCLKLDQIRERQMLRQQVAQMNGSAANELAMLRQASQEINNTLQLDEVLKIILSKAEHVPHVDLAKIYLADKDGNLAKSRSVTKTSPLMKKTGEAHLLFILAQEVALTREISCPRRTTEPIWQQQSLQAVLLIPLISSDKLIGIFALGSQQPQAFAANNTRWLSVFCSQAATAIENAHLFQDLASAYIDLAQSREKILQSRNTLQVLFDGISDGLYILNRDLSINALNRVEAERQGYKLDELGGQSYLSLPWSQAAPDLLERIKESLDTGRETTWISPEYETEPYLKDREFRIYPIRNRLAQIEQVIVFAQDVSERRRWQASLFRSANLAAVGQLAGSIAHQINNPLTVAMANSQLLLLEATPNTEVHELTTGIFKAGERIQNIVQNLLEFSNQETYFFVQTDLINTIEGALALVFRSLKKANIEIVKDYEVQPVLSASISHLKLVWMNFLLNARDAVIGYAGAPQIVIATRSVSEREVKVMITDNGCGIPAKDFDQLFRPFFSTKMTHKALGLGLYSAHTIIERHNGQIKVSSQPGRTTFEVLLPLDNPRDL